MKTDELRILTGYGSIDLLNPTAADVNMLDVVTNLSRIRRWNGAIDFTVDQHSRLVEAILKAKGANRVTCLAGLLDDGPEYATNDIADPILETMRVFTVDQRVGKYETLKNIQTDVRIAIYSKIGLQLQDVDFDAVHAADMEARACEIWWMLPKSPMLDELKAQYPEPSDAARHSFLKIHNAGSDAFMGLLRYYGVEIGL